GAAFSLTVRAVDAYGNLVPLYRGRVSFRSSDSTAVLPRPYRFSAVDQGVHTFTGLKLRQRGWHTLTVIDTENNVITGSVTIEVR
ncbi:MAG TPA: hypothetical protein VM597_32850, partial [Gemmataceae bacterium]|nr:hypothetical protein [Gemmataceae bacterium]